MINHLEYPSTKQVRIFHCKCGCRFQADIADYETLENYINNGYNYNPTVEYLYKISCPFCHIPSLYEESETETKQVRVIDEMSGY